MIHQSPSFVDVFDNALEPAYCAELIDKFEADDRQYAGGLVGQDGQFNLEPEFKKVTELAISVLPEWSDVQKFLLANLGTHLGLLRNIHPGLMYMGGIGNASNLRMKRYDNDGTNHFNWHTDNISHAQSCRVVTFQWYLNTVEEGGETEFAEQGLKIKPEAGKLVAFPPNYTHFHRALPPISEPKYIINTWLQFNGTERLA